MKESSYISLKENLNNTDMCKIDFSIITVCYNSTLTINKCIESVNLQENVSIEHIFIDGNSTDDTVEKIKNISTRKSYLKSEQDFGVFDAMNKGIRVAKGKYIGFLNSDDYFYYNNILSEIKNKFISSNADIVYCGIMYINSKQKITSQWIPTEFKYGEYKNGWHTPHPGFFATNKLYSKYGNFNEDLKIASDYELMLRFMEKKEIKSKKLNIISTIMRNDGQSSTISGRFLGMLDILKSLKLNNIKVFVPLFLLKRYLPKILKYLKIF